jgi:hypothetical protein
MRQAWPALWSLAGRRRAPVRAGTSQAAEATEPFGALADLRRSPYRGGRLPLRYETAGVAPMSDDRHTIPVVPIGDDAPWFRPRRQLLSLEFCSASRRCSWQLNDVSMESLDGTLCGARGGRVRPPRLGIQRTCRGGGPDSALDVNGAPPTPQLCPLPEFLPPGNSCCGASPDLWL